MKINCELRATLSINDVISHFTELLEDQGAENLSVDYDGNSETFDISFSPSNFDSPNSFLQFVREQFE